MRERDEGVSESLNLAKLVSCKCQYHKGFLSRFCFLVLIQESTCIELGLVSRLNRERQGTIRNNGTSGVYKRGKGLD